MVRVLPCPCLEVVHCARWGHASQALAGNWEEARALHYKLLPLMEGNFIESSPGPVKAALAMMGMIEEKLRLPLVPVQEKTRARLREILVEVGLLKETSHAVA